MPDLQAVAARVGSVHVRGRVPAQRQWRAAEAGLLAKYLPYAVAGSS